MPLAEGTGASEAVRGSGAAKQTPPEAKPHSWTGMASFIWGAGRVGEGKGDAKHVSQSLISLSHTPNGKTLGLPSLYFSPVVLW